MSAICTVVSSCAFSDINRITYQYSYIICYLLLMYMCIHTDVTSPTAMTEEQEVPYVLTTNNGMYMHTYVYTSLATYVHGCI